MKKTFLKFLGGAVAAIMLTTGLAVGMTTTALAAEGDAFTVLPSDFYTTGTYTGTSSVNADKTSVTKNGATVTLNNAKNFYNKAGTRGTFTNSTGKSFDTELQTGGGNRTFTISPAADGQITVYWYTTSKDHTINVGDNSVKSSNDTKNTLIATSGYCLKDEDFVIEFVKSNMCMLSIEFVPMTVPKYTWDIDYSELTIGIDKSKLSFTADETTKTTNTLVYTGTDYKLNDANKAVTGVADGQKVTVKPLDSWFTKIEYKEVTPDATGRYDFATAGGENIRLALGSNASKSNQTAYSEPDKAEGDDSVNYVLLTSEGASLYDDSKDAATRLVIPYSASTGKVTVSGEVTPTNKKGSKWAICDLGMVSLYVDKNSNVVIGNNISSDDGYAGLGNSNAGAINEKSKSKLNYSITVDLDNKTVTAHVTNTNASDKVIDIKDVPYTHDVPLTKITFTTNSSGSVTGTDDRALLIPSVTIKKEAAEDKVDGNANDKAAVIKGADGTYYAVVIVSEADAKTNSAVEVSADENKVTIDTVYSKVAIGDNEYTAEDLGGSTGDYVSGIKLTINNSSATVSAAAIQAIINVDKVAVA